MRALKDLSKLDSVAFKLDNFIQKIAELKKVRASINELIEKEYELTIEIQKTLSQNNYDFTDLMDDAVLSSIKKSMSLEFISRFICDYTGFNHEDIFGNSRRQELLYCRYAFIYLARNYTDVTFKRIGTFCLDRDHSTVMAGLRTAEDLLFTKQAPLLTSLVKTFETKYSRYKNVHNTNNAGDNHAGDTNLSC